MTLQELNQLTKQLFNSKLSTQLKNSILYGHKQNSLNCGMTLGNMNTGTYRGGVTPLTSTVYSNLSDSVLSNASIYTALNTKVATKILTGFADIGKYAQISQIKLQKVGSPTGTIYGKAWNSSGTELVSSAGLDGSTIPISVYTTYTFDMLSPALVGLDHYFGLELVGGSSDSSNYWVMPLGTVDNIANTDTWYYNGSWAFGQTRSALMLFDSAPTI